MNITLLEENRLLIIVLGGIVALAIMGISQLTFRDALENIMRIFKEVF
jgi:hypothetical protein